MRLRINENESIVDKFGGRNYSNINPILQEYLDFLEEAGIEVLNVYLGTKSIEVRNKDLEDASFYLCGRDYFGKDLYKQGWSVVSNI